MKRRTMIKMLCIAVLICITAFSLNGCKKDNKNNISKYVNDTAEEASLDKFNNPDTKLATLIGTIHGDVALERLPDIKLSYTNNISDGIQQVINGVIDGFVLDKPVAEYAVIETDGIMIYPDEFEKNTNAFACNKNADGLALSKQISEYILKIKENGELEEMRSKWFSLDEDKKVVSIPKDCGSGTIDFAVNCTIVPFTYIKEEKPVGLDIDIMSGFCREYGYGLNIVNLDFSGIIAGISSGKYDVGGSCITVTEERKESMYFTEPYYDGGIVLILKTEKENSNQSFISSVKSSFNKTFIRESRWKMVIRGMKMTLFISVFSIIFGTILGFIICMLRMTQNRVVNLLTSVFTRLVQGTPIIVLLLILFYIVFAPCGMNGIWVSIITLALNMSVFVSEMMKSGIESVDKGQNEAALALGYTKSQSFFKIVFPQAVCNFIPVYRGQVITLIQTSSIVGYIGVEDLTRISDIIRARTYEAFFPIIATALIYFMIFGVFTAFLIKIQHLIEPNRKKRKVKGVIMK